MATTTDTKPPAAMTTPALVREYAERKVSTALKAERDHVRGVPTDVTAREIREVHDRHVAVCEELRSRGVLD